jgi:hypothetical protein
MQDGLSAWPDRANTEPAREKLGMGLEEISRPLGAQQGQKRPEIQADMGADIAERTCVSE